jgi:hypothetical protein
MLSVLVLLAIMTAFTVVICMKPATFKSEPKRGVCYAVALSALVSFHAGSTFGALAESTAHSEYTSLDAGCKMLWRAADQHPPPPLPDSFKSICPGRDGIRVILEGGDARSWIGLLPRGAKGDQGKRLHANWGGFPQVTGKRLEWRYEGPKLVALIVRVEWTEQSDAGDTKDVSGLAIWRVDAAKLDQACLVGQTTSNEEARAMADDLSKRCPEN